MANRPLGRVLLAEDEKTTRDVMVAYLERAGYEVRCVGDGISAVREFKEGHFDTVLLDLMLPRLSGERVCYAIRNLSDVPIIMVTAKGEVGDKLIGFGLGADDYLVKPFSPKELVARIGAVMKRARVSKDDDVEPIAFDGLVIDVSGHRVFVEGEERNLTSAEFKLLTVFAKSPGRLFSRSELMELVLGYDFEGYERTIDSHIKNLRAKLGDSARRPRWIHTVHGEGYRFEA